MRDHAQDTGWFKSSYSGSASVNCVEVRITSTTVLVRDSKNPSDPQVLFGPTAWRAFLADT
jgi:hypothetical protein